MMKNSIILIGLSLLLAACGASRQAAKEVAPTPQPIIEDVAVVPETPEIPETPEVPDPPVKEIEEEVEEEVEETVTPLSKEEEEHVDTPTLPVYCLLYTSPSPRD